ncbi:hypothetical protein Desku_2443 [Desulfofundulus kuznetsovii DSM 6115]|uniref:Prepilin-type N-terminal cleavage/methylation domain-containing protein n=1 Tax=Desulfofundulus kuznetsovii (strain DSM 6115 / VKM B-1805 / 17) TaxID=760568 RepID=A0AAU8PB79_DESK7|nr:hypothetical protein Desku_2443 [Desulfofundulus kuznetsovii DSM 6115]
MCRLKKCLSGEEGYSLAEILVVAVALATVAASVLAILMPEVRSLYQKAVGAVTDIMGSGF